MLRMLSTAVGAVLLAVLLPGPANAATTPQATASTGTARVVPAPADDGTFKVVTQRSYRDDAGFTIFAELKNKTKWWRTKIRGTVSYFDGVGRRIATYPAYPQLLFAPPKGRITLKYYQPSPPTGYDHYRLTFTSEKAKSKKVPAQHLKVKVGAVAIDPQLGGLNVPVRVTNRNVRKVRHVAVYVSLYDGSGRILTLFDGYNYTSPSKLRPRQAGRFTAYFGSRFQGVRTVRVQVEASIKR